MSKHVCEQCGSELEAVEPKNCSCHLCAPCREHENPDYTCPQCEGG